MTFHKGQSGNPAGKKPGTKNKTTLLKEERRAMFDSWVSENWLATIKRLPPVYIADQFIGKSPDKVELSGEVRHTQLTQEQIDAINKIALDE